MESKTALIPYIEQSLRSNWERLAMSDYQGNTLLYRDVARKVVKLHILFDKAGLKPGDRIALCGRNSSAWAVVAIASLAYGTVLVPILSDFTPDTVQHLVKHCDARIMFTDKAIWDKLDANEMPELEGAFLIQDYSLLFSRNEKLTEGRNTLNQIFGDLFPERFSPDDIYFKERPDDSLAVINYTSGSTGFSKGVMLSYAALWSNIQFTIDGLTFLKPGDGIVCMLPLAHMFGFTVEMLHPFVKGCHLTFITRTPSPKIILDAFATVKPKLIVTVPLIIEKIVKTRVFPILDKPLMKLLLVVPFIDDRLLAKIKEKLEQAFGGNVQQIIIGGAALNKDVETFLRRISFPFTVGYGMTECGPLIAYAPADTQRPGSCGKLVTRMEMRVDSPNPVDTPGVLYVRGINVMQGYLNNEEATKSVLAEDGWLNTGDIVNVDQDGYIYIRGRDKSLILGPSGQNIYPEEIEQKINNLPYVAESLVVSDPENNGKLLALIFPDMDTAKAQGISEEQIERTMRENVSKLNQELPSYSQLADVRIQAEEFEKTPKRSIKRYLYQK